MERILKWCARSDLLGTLMVDGLVGEMRIKSWKEDSKIPEAGSLRHHAMISKK